MTTHSRPLRGISEIRGFLRTNDTPVFFVSPTAFNLLGIDRWIGGTHLSLENTWRWHPTKHKLVPPSRH